MDRTDTALLMLRVMLGLFMAAHGTNKVKGGLAGTAGWFGSIGMKWPRAQATAAAATEIVGGILLAIGLLFPLAAASMIATMTVAIVTVHRKVGFFIFLPGGGWEYCATISVAVAALSVAGPGTVSIDHAAGILGSTTAGVAGVITGLAAAVAHLAVSWRPGTVAK